MKNTIVHDEGTTSLKAVATKVKLTAAVIKIACHRRGAQENHRSGGAPTGR